MIYYAVKAIPKYTIFENHYIGVYDTLEAAEQVRKLWNNGANKLSVIYVIEHVDTKDITIYKHAYDPSRRYTLPKSHNEYNDYD